MTHRPLASVLFLLAACFQSPGSIPIRCDTDNPCPVGQMCSEAGLCVALLPMDLATPPDQALASVGCANSATGQKLSDRVWGCAGAFAVGGARALCSPGWAVCKDPGDLDPIYCADSVPSFFIGDLAAYRPLTTLLCGTTSTLQRLFGGCGISPNASRFDNICTRFLKFAVDKGGGYDFSAGHSIEQAANTNPLVGVLCCKP